MKSKQQENLQTETRDVLDSIRIIVKSLRNASKLTEKSIGLSAAQLFVLQKIGESDRPLRINDLAELTLTHQSSVSVVVAKLVKKNLVNRLPSKEDGRAVEVCLSRKGMALISERSPLIQERIVDGIGQLSHTDRDGLVRGLRALIQKSGLQELEPSLFFEDETTE